MVSSRKTGALRSGLHLVSSPTAVGLLIVLAGCLTPRPSTAPSNFHDANLDKVVREALQIPSGPIDEYFLQGLVELVATHKDISDLSGIEKCTGLRRLILAENRIRDIRMLAGLTTLTELDLSGNPVIGIAPLSALTNLRYLRLSGVPGQASIADLLAIANMRNLIVLDLRNQNLAGVDMGPLSNLVNLVELILQRTGIEDVAPLAGLAKLEVLALDLNRITEITPLKPLTKLRSLDIGSNQVSDISAVAGMTRLENLVVDTNPVRDLTPISDALSQGSFRAGGHVALSTAGVDISAGSANEKAIADLKAAGVAVEVK